jgi:hypothetical protein
MLNKAAQPPLLNNALGDRVPPARQVWLSLENSSPIKEPSRIIRPNRKLDLFTRLTPNTTEDSRDAPVRGGELTVLAGCGVTVLGVLVLTLVFAFFQTMFRNPGLSTLRQAEGLTSFFANVVVVFYAFPAFIRTKDRALLCVAFAALSFAYGALFTLLLGVRPPATAWHVAHV